MFVRVCTGICMYVSICRVSLVYFPVLSLCRRSRSHPAHSQRSACHQSEVARRPECSGVPVKAGELPCLADVCPPEGSRQRKADAPFNVPLVSVMEWSKAGVGQGGGWERRGWGKAGVGQDEGGVSFCAADLI